MRRLSCLAAIALASLAFPQDGKVTYTTVAVSAKRALAEMSAKCGMKLACSPAMEREVLILRLQDAPIDDAMKQIAAVTSGDWKKEGETYYLVANGSARLAEDNRQLQRRAEVVTKSIKNILDQISKTAEGIKNAKDIKAEDNPRGMMYEWDQNAALYKLAAAIGPARIAAIAENGRVVYSSNPTQMQRDLPAGAAAIIDQYIVVHNKSIAASKSNQQPTEILDDRAAAMRDLYGGSYRKPTAITSAPAKALLIVSRQGRYDDYSVELKLYDASGKILASDATSISSSESLDGPDMDEENPPAKPPPTGAEIQLSPLAKELSLLSRGNRTTTPKLSKELSDSLLDPVASDPLSYLPSEGLIAVAVDHKEQLVADLPDDAISDSDGDEKLTIDGFLADLKAGKSAKVVEAGGWMIVSPDDPVQSRARRTDRFALRTLIKSAQIRGSVSLDDLSAYAVKNGSPMEDAPASDTYFMLFAPSALEMGMMGPVNWDMLRLYGMMSESQRQTLRTNGQLPFGQLTSEQQGQLAKMVFGADENLQVENPEDAAKAKQDPLTEMMMAGASRYGGSDEDDYRTEPTEAMPHGLPQNGTVVLSFSTEPVAQPQTTSEGFGGALVSLGPRELGMFKFYKEDPAMAKLAEHMPTFDDLKVGTRSIYDFSFYVAPSTVTKARLNDDAYAKDAQVYKLNALPADFQKRIDEIAALCAKSPFFKAMGGTGERRSRTPPPG